MTDAESSATASTASCAIAVAASAASAADRAASVASFAAAVASSAAAAAASTPGFDTSVVTTMSVPLIALAIAPVAAVPSPKSVHVPFAVPAIGRTPFDVATPETVVIVSPIANGAVDQPEVSTSSKKFPVP